MDILNIIQEINIDKLLPTRVTDRVNVNKPMFIHLLPDIYNNLNAADLLLKSGFKLTNCIGIITKPQFTQLGTKKFNGKEIYLYNKQHLATHNIDDEDSNQTKLLTVYDKIPKGLDNLLTQNKYILVDHTIISRATNYMLTKVSEKNALFFMLQQLKKEFNEYKSLFSNFEHNILILYNQIPIVEQGIANNLYELTKLLLSNSKKYLDNLNIFDKYILSSVTGEIPYIIPIIGYNKEGDIVIYKNNIKKLEKNIYYKQEIETPNLDEKSAVIDNKKDIEFVTDRMKFFDKIPTKANIKTIKPEIAKIPIVLQYNQDQLTKIFKKYKIRDKEIADNITTILNTHLKSNPDIEKNQNNIEKILLFAINKTLFNKDDIDDYYLQNPSRLFSKLQEVNTYSKDINYPEINDMLLQPKNIIELDKVTGIVRHEYEFSDNIHENIKELFTSLENRPNSPIKIVNFKYEYEDNNLNRIINYTITLKNLTGGIKEPYTVSVKIPSLVNDRYFKLNGKNYILSTQQFFQPITKTEPNECRLLTSYGMLTLSVVNLKFNISEINNILKYISNIYPESIINIEHAKNSITHVELKDKLNNIYVINQYNEDIYLSKYEKLVYDANTGKFLLTELNDKNEGILIPNKSEFLYSKLISIIKTYNPNESLKKSPKSIPYLQIHLSGTKVPLILYMWQQLGLLNGLTKLGLTYEIRKDQNVEFNNEVIPFIMSDSILYINIFNERQRLIVNGLLTINSNTSVKFSSNDININTSIDQFIINKNSTRSIYNLNISTTNLIDIRTKQILEEDNKSSNVIDLISQDMVPKLLNSEPDSLTDLKIYRTRQAELMFTMLYKELMIAHNTYVNELKFNDNAKLFLKDEYVIESILGIHTHVRGSATAELANPFNPLAELKAASKLIKTGPGGVPNKRSFKKSHRNIHSSHIGNLGACATTEYADVGLTTHFTLNPLLTNKFGSFGYRDANMKDAWNTVAIDEALVPFLNQIHSDRMILAYTHRSQCAPISNGDVPLISTGAEYIIPQLSSSKFIHIAKQDGEILEKVPDKYLKIKYKNGQISYIDITPRLTSTKRGSYIRLGFTLLDKKSFKKNEAMAWTNSFKDNAYAIGKNLIMAVMNYRGYGHEDGYVINEKVSDDFKNSMVEEVNVILPENITILSLVDEMKDTNPGDPLVEFTYGGDLDSYIDNYNLIDEESEENDASVYNYINNKITTNSPGGTITDIKIFLNTKDVDNKVLSLWKKVTNDLKERQKLYEYGKITPREKVTANDNLDMSQIKVGNHKFRGVVFPTARIVYYIKKDKYLNTGDKVCNRYGAKGTITKRIAEENIPKAEYSGDIDIFLSPISILGRRNLCSLKELYAGKIFYNLPKILSTYTNVNKIKKDIEYIYKTLDESADKNYLKEVMNNINKYTDNELLNKVKNKEIKFNYIVQPFKDIKIQDIKSVLKYLDIPADEYIFIPELNAYTKTRVPVGINYMNAMEQISEDYESIRSTGGYKSSTGQPLKGKTNVGGQSIGNLDIYALLSYESNNMLEELMTIRSDDFKSKRELTINIMENGNSNIPDNTGNSTTSQLYKTHLIAMGITPM